MASTGPRPFGVGAYGTGPYSRYGPPVHNVQGRSGIVFDARALRPAITISPSAVSGIMFSLRADLEFSWPAWAPCEPGGWQPAGPCEGGTWQPSTGCSAGAWDEQRLEELTP